MIGSKEHFFFCFTFTQVSSYDFKIFFITIIKTAGSQTYISEDRLVVYQEKLKILLLLEAIYMHVVEQKNHN